MLFAFSSADDVYSELTSTDFKVVVNCNGTATWFTSGKMSVNCPLVLTRFPFDVQTCSIKMESWTYNGNEQSLWEPHLHCHYGVLRGTWSMGHQ